MRRIVAIILLMCLLTPAMAGADAIYDWALSCRMKTGGVTAVYRDAAFTQLIATIPANTYVKIVTSVNGVAAISYMTADGVKGGGYTARSGIVSAVVTYYDEDGFLTDMHELLWDGSLSTREEQEAAGHPTMPPERNDGASTESTASGTQQSNTLPNMGSTANALQGKTTEPDGVLTADGQQVEVVLLGMAESLVLADGQEKSVPTSQLVFGSNDVAERRIAVIWAPNTGECTLRKGPSDSARSLGQCRAGTIVAVLEPGDKYTKVLFRGEIGYIKTRSLQFHDGAAAVLGTGMLTYNGHGTGKTNINIRCNADGNSAKIAEWRTGTLVAVLSAVDGWYEIEYRGVRGYVMEKFLTMQN